MPETVTYPAVPVDRIPSDPLRPSALKLTVKFDFGSLLVPRLVNGPPKPSVSGLLSVLEPDGLSDRLTFTLPLLTVCLPLNVCCSRLLA